MEVYILNTSQYAPSQHHRGHSWSFIVRLRLLIAVIIGLRCWLNRWNDFIILYTILKTQRRIQPTIRASKHLHAPEGDSSPYKKTILHKHTTINTVFLYANFWGGEAVWISVRRGQAIKGSSCIIQCYRKNFRKVGRHRGWARVQYRKRGESWK